MPSEARIDKRVEKSQSDEPAKGGTEPPHKKPDPAGDSAKPHGDKLQHATDEAARKPG